MYHHHGRPATRRRGPCRHAQVETLRRVGAVGDVRPYIGLRRALRPDAGGTQNDTEKRRDNDTNHPAPHPPKTSVKPATPYFFPTGTGMPGILTLVMPR
jgi:hypothetical protein